jgi:dTDP-4-amino-4,6-dideoxygalactose transaminase
VRLDGRLEPTHETSDSPSIYHLFAVRVAERDALARELARRGIATGVHYPVAIPDQPAMPELANFEAPVARAWATRELSLPLFPEMTEDEVELVTDAVGLALQDLRCSAVSSIEPARR